MSIFEEARKLIEKLMQDQAITVKVALFGQPGSGKSSIINKLIGENVADIGQSTDVTVEAKEYEWGQVKLVDLPGFGTKKFPKESYFDEFKIPTFDLFLCVFSGKFHQADTEFFQELKRIGKVCIFVRNKHDEIWEDDKCIKDLEKDIIEDTKKQVNSSNIEFVFTSCRRKIGFDKLQELILENLEPAKKERWARGSKAYSFDFLNSKKEACEKYIYLASGVAAVNALNPIPGADIAVDLSVLIKLFTSIRSSYGLTDEKLKGIEIAIPAIAPLANNVIKYATKEGILFLLKKYVGRQTLKQVSKYVPFVGQAIAATAGFGITMAAGISYLNDCHEIAEKILENELAKGK